MAISGSLTISFCPNSKGRHLLFSLLLIQSFSLIIYFVFNFLHIYGPLIHSIYAFFFMTFPQLFFQSCSFFILSIISLLSYHFSPNFPYTFSIFYSYTSSCFFHFSSSFFPIIFPLYSFTISFQYLTSVIFGDKLPALGSRCAVF